MANKETFKEYKDAILTMDAAKVAELLDQGVSPNIRIEHEHPLLWTTNIEEGVMSDFLYGIERPDLADKLPVGINYKIAARKTANVLLEHGIKLYSKPEMAEALIDREHFILDDLLLSDSKETLVDIALYTIKQSMEHGLDAYRFMNYGFYYKNIKDYINRPLEDFTNMLSAKLRSMQEIHDAVAMRLADPKTEIEKELTTKYADKIEYWTDSYQVPLLDEVIENVNYMGDKFFKDFEKEVAVAEVKKSKYKVGVDVSLQKMKRDGDVYILPEEKPQDVLRDLEALVGLKKEKKEFLKWAVEVTKRDNSDPEETIGYSSAYLGNPGTAKTTLFRLKARFLHSMGLVGDKYREVTAGELEAGYVGQTAIKTRAVLKSCDVLFIDEAYALAKQYSSGSYGFGKEAVDEIVAFTENNRNMPIFFAGYQGDMQRLFAMNAGLQSRVSNINNIDDYSVEDLAEIFERGVKERGYKGVDADAKEALMEDLKFYKDKMGDATFANGREIRNILDSLNGIVKERHYRLESELESGANLADIFTKLSSKKVIRRSEMSITVADIKELKLREKHKTFNNKEPERELIGFKMPAVKVANDTGIKEDVAVARIKGALDFNKATRTVEKSKEWEEPYVPYKSTRIGFTA